MRILEPEQTKNWNELGIEDLVDEIKWDMALGYELNREDIVRVRNMVDRVEGMDKEGMYKERMQRDKEFLGRIEQYK